LRYFLSRSSLPQTSTPLQFEHTLSFCKLLANFQTLTLFSLQFLLQTYVLSPHLLQSCLPSTLQQLPSELNEKILNIQAKFILKIFIQFPFILYVLCKIVVHLLQLRDIIPYAQEGQSIDPLFLVVDVRKDHRVTLFPNLVYR
jgi:hypothetical protein